MIWSVSSTENSENGFSLRSLRSLRLNLFAGNRSGTDDEAVVRFDGLNAPAIRHARALEGVDNGLARVRQHVGVVLALFHFLRELDRRRVMPPAEQARNRIELLALLLCVLGRVLFRCEEE